MKKKTQTNQKQSKPPSFLTTFLILASFGVLLGGGIITYTNPKPKISNNTKAILVNETTPTSVPQVLGESSIEEKQKDIEIEINDHLQKIREPLPQTTAKAIGIYIKKNQNSNEFVEISSFNKDKVLPFGSIAKLMTALVAIDNYPLDKRVTVIEKCESIKDGSNVGFKAGDVFTLQDLLYALLVKSGADAACTITNMNEDESKFISDMNKKAKELKMNDTTFVNSIGFDAGLAQVSSVEDLEILSEQILKNAVLRKIIGTQIIEITSKNSVKKYKFESTNDLLKSIPGTVGIKTGSTPSAGECLSYLYSDGENEIMIIILGSSNRFGDTKLLLDWARQNNVL